MCVLIDTYDQILLQIKGKVHPRIGHEGPESEQMYGSTLPSTSALDGGWVVNATLRPLYLRERPVTSCIGCWVGPRAGLEGCGKSRPSPGIRSPCRPTRSESLYRLHYPGSLPYIIRAIKFQKRYGRSM